VRISISLSRVSRLYCTLTLTGFLDHSEIINTQQLKNVCLHFDVLSLVNFLLILSLLFLHNNCRADRASCKHCEVSASYLQIVHCAAFPCCVGLPALRWSLRIPHAHFYSPKCMQGRSQLLKRFAVSELALHDLDLMQLSDFLFDVAPIFNLGFYFVVDSSQHLLLGPLAYGFF